jgi:TniQ
MHPIHPKPQPGEALTSWLVRTAAARGILVHVLIQQLVGDREFWTRDGDLLAPHELLKAIAHTNGVSTERAEHTTLRSLEGVLDERISGNNQSAMIRPMGVFHRDRRGYGQQACPDCLKEDKSYYRLLWRLRLITCCTRHGAILVEECANCAAPIIPHRGGLLHCHVCGTDLRDCPAAPANSRVLQLQYENERVLGGKTVMWPYLQGTAPIAFFRLQLSLLRAITLKNWGERVRTELAKHIGVLPIDFRDSNNNLRSMTTASTHHSLRGVELLLQGWPAMFAGICQEARAWGTWIVPEERDIQTPFILQSAMDSYLRPGSSNNRI